ncbi:hypothetical protein BH11ACT8_BH11ACT8_35970 [soil metagenome]
MQSSSHDVSDLLSTWPLPAPALRDALVAAYADPSRGYHDTLHLAEVLDRVGTLEAAGERFDSVPVVLAAWFHDSVYDGERDAEERSAAWAEDSLPGLTDEATIAEVARLVRLTESHRPDEHDANGCVLSDADLGILAAPAERYAAYVAAVRQEYAHLPDETFRAGRHLVLSDLLAKPRLFHTEYAFTTWEQAARHNATAELEQLAASAS